MSERDTTRERSPEPVEWKPGRPIIIDTTGLTPAQALLAISAFTGPVDPRPAEEIRDAASFRRGMLRAAELAEHERLAEPSGEGDEAYELAIDHVSAAIRAEANAPATREALSNE